MHSSSLLRMKWFVENYASKLKKDKIKVLDVGSFDVNGSYKQFYSDAKRFEYTGLDMAKGPNVDIVLENPYNWAEIGTESFDIVISGQAFEHVEFFWITMSEMTRVLKKDGLLCIIVPNGFGEHRYPVDCYRFFSDGMVALARYVSLDVLHAHTNAAPAKQNAGWYSEKDADSVLIAQKPYSGTTQLVNTSTYVCVPADQEALRTGLVPYKRNLIRKLLRKALSTALR